VRVPLSRPDVAEREVQLVNEVLHSGFLSSGEMTRRFEEAVAGYVGTRFAVAVNSGTSALHLIVRALGLGPGDEVVTTPFSFVASSNVLLYEGVRPVFVDVEPRTLNIDVDHVEDAITARTKAILPVDVFGHPAPLDRIRELAEGKGLRVIEDACEALGAELDGTKTGSGRFCDAAAFAFYPNKQITTGEGGVVVTDDERTAALCRSMRNQGRADPAIDGAPDGGARDGWLFHPRVGYNYRITEMSAALGVAQMDRIDEILERRRAVAEAYTRRLKGVGGVTVPSGLPGATVSWFVYVVRLDDGVDRARVIGRLRDRGIECKPYFPPIHLQPPYVERFGYREGMYPVAERAARTTVALPFYTALGEGEIEYVPWSSREPWSSPAPDRAGPRPECAPRSTRSSSTRM